MKAIDNQDKNVSCHYSICTTSTFQYSYTHCISRFHFAFFFPSRLIRAVNERHLPFFLCLAALRPPLGGSEPRYSLQLAIPKLDVCGANHTGLEAQS